MEAQVQIEIPQKQIEDFCKRWKVTEMALFGSVLRHDFRPDSDVDVLLTYAPDAEWSLMDIVDLREELMALFGRDVDVVSRDAIENSRNYIRRKEILGTAKVIYEARPGQSA